MSKQKQTNNQLIRYNPMTKTYHTQDDTSVSAELVDNVECLADVLYITLIRSKQRGELLRGRE
jgi:hypothetical protein